MIADQREPRARRANDGVALAGHAADWLYLAAAPTFAFMALATGFSANNAGGSICAAANGTSLLVGMTPMYLLMSVFHLAPWLRRVSARHMDGLLQSNAERPVIR